MNHCRQNCHLGRRHISSLKELIIASSDSEDMNLTPRYIDTEIKKRLFYHVWFVLTREKQVGVCAAEDCEQFLISQPRGNKQLYCSPKVSVAAERQELQKTTEAERRVE